MKKYSHQITKFQSTLPHDGEVIIEIISLLYPDLNIDWANQRGNIKIEVHPCYTWVTVKYKDIVNFALDNHGAKINGQSIYGKIDSTIYKRAQFYFKVLMFSDRPGHETSEIRKQRVDKLLRSKGYQKPTFEEWFNEYHTD